MDNQLKAKQASLGRKCRSWEATTEKALSYVPTILASFTGQTQRRSTMKGLKNLKACAEIWRVVG